MKKDRILIVDAVRGFALLGIALIHFVEHFELFSAPKSRYLIPESVDQVLHFITFLLISGKAYSMFALMFGYSFFIQMNNQGQQGLDFSTRFLWRLMILMAMGFVHSLIYRGDILLIYALLGLLLIPLYRVNTKVLTWLGVILLLQVPILVQIGIAFLDPNYVYTEHYGDNLWGKVNQVYEQGSFLQVVEANYWTSRLLVWKWTFYVGRYMQLFALFIVGLLVGRNALFENIMQYKKKLQKVVFYSFAGFTVLYLFKDFGLKLFEFNDSQSRLLSIWLKSITDCLFMFGAVSLLSLVYQKNQESKFFTWLATYGRMSLSNYVTQGILGVLLFYGFGLEMWKYLGTTWSIMLGILFFAVQVMISRWWMSHYFYGPLEWLWRAITYFDFNLKMRR